MTVAPLGDRPAKSYSTVALLSPRITVRFADESSMRHFLCRAAYGLSMHYPTTVLYVYSVLRAQMFRPRKSNLNCQFNSQSGRLAKRTRRPYVPPVLCFVLSYPSRTSMEYEYGVRAIHSQLFYLSIKSTIPR